jgi:hypothetical protein
MPDISLRESIALVKRLGEQGDPLTVTTILRVVREQTKPLDEIEKWPQVAWMLIGFGLLMYVVLSLMLNWHHTLALMGAGMAFLGLISIVIHKFSKSSGRTEVDALIELRTSAIDSLGKILANGAPKKLNEDQKVDLRLLIKRTGSDDPKILALLES